MERGGGVCVEGEGRWRKEYMEKRGKVHKKGRVCEVRNVCGCEGGEMRRTSGACAKGEIQ